MAGGSSLGFAFGLTLGVIFGNLLELLAGCTLAGAVLGLSSEAWVRRSSKPRENE